MSVYEESHTILIGISGEYDHSLATTQPQSNSTTKWANFYLHHLPVITTPTASISEI